MGELLRNARFGFLQSLAKTIRGSKIALRFVAWYFMESKNSVLLPSLRDSAESRIVAIQKEKYHYVDSVESLETFKNLRILPFLSAKILLNYLH